MWRGGRLIFIFMHDFKTVNQQINILKRRGMLFKDLVKAKDTLKQINYYNLINGNKKFFCDANSPIENYVKNIYFEEIVFIYSIEFKLKELVFKNILLIEERLKRHLAYEFAKEYGSYSWDDINSYSHFSKRNEDYSTLFIRKLKDKLKIKNNDTRDKLVEHFYNQDEKIPIWAFVNLFDFGLAKYFYINLNEKMKTKIAKYFSLSPKQLKSFFETLNMFRNVCAHNNKLFFYKIYDKNKKIADMPIHRLLNIEKRQNQYAIGKNDLFAVVIIFKYMLRKEEFLLFYTEIVKLFDSIKTECKIIEYNKVCNSLGFPVANNSQCDWQNIINY